ncbi:MAG: thioredoxin, partial [Acidobacteria bacterium]|nr:thioredoxin [Acidobacteriota bacterium]
MPDPSSTTHYLVFLKQECHTCSTLEPVIRALKAQPARLRIVVQDEPEYLADLGAEYDQTLELSFRHQIEVTPTLIRFAGDTEAGRTDGWVRAEWRQLTEIDDLGADQREMMPGCGSKSHEPGVYERLQARFGDSGLTSRPIETGEWDDPMEICFERGWTDGLPVVPPTDERILRMLRGTARKPQEIVGLVPPNLAECTVEKVAINAVMAGCKPEYLPVLLTALEAALEPIFAMHGVLCTTCSAGPVIVVNG